MPMSRPQNAMEIFRLLDKSNCMACGEKTCLAFAGAVYQGRKAVADCPRIGREALDRYGDGRTTDEAPTLNEDLRGLSGLDFQEAAERSGGRISGGRLTLKVLEKDFGVDPAGRFYADIHVNPWVAGPFLRYILHGSGLAPTGDWVSFRELKDGKARYPLFRKRCEEAMRAVADRYGDLFDDLVHLFGGRHVEPAFASDISVVLHPLPKVPVMICYWRPEGALSSTLNIFFDRTADRNLDIGALFSLAAGLARMFETLALRHGAVCDAKPQIQS
jgi:hypothetical protein